MKNKIFTIIFLPIFILLINCSKENSVTENKTEELLDIELEEDNVIRNITDDDILWKVESEAFFRDMIQASNGNYVVCGSKNGTEFIAMINKEGEYVWEKEYGDRSALSLVELNDEFIVLGETFQTVEYQEHNLVEYNVLRPTYAKIDYSGNLIKYDYMKSNKVQGININDIAITNDNKIQCVGYVTRPKIALEDHLGEDGYFMEIDFDTEGNFIITSSKTNSSGLDSRFYSITPAFDGGSLIVGFQYTATSGLEHLDPGMTLFYRTSNGSFRSSELYDYTTNVNYASIFRKVIKTNSHYLIAGQSKYKTKDESQSSTQYWGGFITKLGPDLNTISDYELRGFDNQSIIDIISLDNGGFIVVGSETTIRSDPFLAEIDEKGNLTRVLIFEGKNLIKNILQVNDGYLVLGSNYVYKIKK